jgi:hypothetical protein
MKPAVLFLLALLPGAALQEPRTLPARIDEEVARMPGMKDPAAVCSDGDFLRRAMLDLVGYPPGADEVRAFAADPSPEKRAAKVDELLAGDRFADFWARRWMAVFFGNYHAFRLDPLRSLPPDDAARLMESFRRWLKDRLKEDRSWESIVRELLEAEGSAADAPAVVYKLGTVEWPRVPHFENRAALHFLGLDFSCAGCHDHPFDRFRVEDGWSLMAFSMGRTIRRGPQGFEIQEGPGSPKRMLVVPGFTDEFRRPLLVIPRFPDGAGPAEGEVLAKAFSRIVTAKGNPTFRAAAVNRVWTWLLGRGIVKDTNFNLMNKPLSRSLLPLLATEFEGHGHSFKFLIRSICGSATYQRRSDIPGTVASSGAFSRGLIRPLSAEQILGSLDVAILSRPSLDVSKAQALAEKLIRGDAPICEVTEVRADARALVWLASDEDLGKSIREGPVLARIQASADPVKEMFLAALSREPDADEAARVAAFLKEGDLAEAYRVLLNTAEFLTRH